MPEANPLDQADPLDQIVERIADAVIRKMDEREKIDLIADAVLERLNKRAVDAVGPMVDEPRPTVHKTSPTRASRIGVGQAKRKRR